MADWSQTFTFLDGEWLEGNRPILGPRTHAFWLGSSVFDGARAFEGVAPDLDQHCARVNRSARTMWLKPTMSDEAIVELAREGVKKFAPGAELYIRPMYWAERNGRELGAARPGVRPASVCRSTRRRCPSRPAFRSPARAIAKPLGETMPIDAKAGCLYPNNARALMEARARGFDNCLLADMLGNVAELATANVFMARDGVVMTPIANGSFLNGVTRQRVLQLLAAGRRGRRETTLSFADFDEADEIFVVGNYGKVTPVRRIEERDLQPGPLLPPRPRALLGVRPFLTPSEEEAHDDPLDHPAGFDSGRRLGAGKIALLELIEGTGSISAAGRAHAMSYRRAWLLVDELNQLFAAPLSRPTMAARKAAAPGSPTRAGGSWRSIARRRRRCVRPPAARSNPSNANSRERRASEADFFSRARRRRRITKSCRSLPAAGSEAFAENKAVPPVTPCQQADRSRRCWSNCANPWG